MPAKQIPDKSYSLEIVVFFIGALVMIYEITGSRILAPYIGTSTFVWTSLIGTILASLSLGYAFGGKIADKKQDTKILALALLLASIILSVTILLKDSFLLMLSQSDLNLKIKVFIAPIVVFAPVSILCGFVSPYVIRLRMSEIENSGKIVGRLYALSTAGSILGTFAAGFILIPSIGSTRILYVIAGLLLLLSIMLVRLSLGKTKIAALLLMLITIGYTEIKIYAFQVKRDLYDFDTEYNRVRIVPSVENSTGSPLRLMMTDPYSAQSGMYLNKDELFGDYTKYYHLLRYFKPDFKDVLMIGGAGYSFPKDFLRSYPQAKIEVVEIDSGMTEIAKKFFRLRELPNLKITHEEGRVFLNQTGDGKYDVVLLDAFGSILAVPFQLTTVEAVRQMHRALSQDGVVILNLISGLRGEKSRFLTAEYKTFRQIFQQVYVFKVNSASSDNELQNVILVACKNDKITLNPDAAGAEISDMLRHKYELNLSGKKEILTDDFAPVEYYTSLTEVGENVKY